jgi:hypothetical protein
LLDYLVCSSLQGDVFELGRAYALVRSDYVVLRSVFNLSREIVYALLNGVESGNVGALPRRIRSSGGI